MRLLLDTHVVLWALRTPDRLPPAAAAAIRDRVNTIHVSAVSAFEVATKARIDELPGIGPILLGWEHYVAQLNAEELPLAARHSLIAGELRWDHRDPFDRLLAGQSAAENMTLVTGDTAFREAVGIRVLWD